MKQSTRWIALSLILATSVAYADDAAKPAPPPADTKPAPPKEASGATADVKVGTGVEKHEIVGEAATFPAGTTIWVWSRITNGEGNIKHVWKLDGKPVWTATLAVGSKAWSTQSRRAIPKAGAWEVEVQTEDGAAIGKVAFTIQ